MVFNISSLRLLNRVKRITLNIQLVTVTTDAYQIYHLLMAAVFRTARDSYFIIQAFQRSFKHTYLGSDLICSYSAGYAMVCPAPPHATKAGLNRGSKRA